MHQADSAPNPGSSPSAGQGDTGTSTSQLIQPAGESHLSRNEQVMTAARTDVNNHHETPGEQPGVPVKNQFHTLDKVDKLTRAVSSTAAETDDGAQTEIDSRHQRDLADDDGVNGITLLSVDGCNQSITATADMGADSTLSGVDGDDVRHVARLMGQTLI